MAMQAGRRLRRWAALAMLVLASAAAPLAAAQAAFTRHGTWWNPAEPGTGFFFEAQGSQAIATFFVYADDGRPVWYSALGALTASGSGHRFQGDLLQFSDGPPVNDPDSAPPPAASPVGAVTIQFDGARAQVQLPARSFAAEKYATRPPAPRNGATGPIPETGIYWDPTSSGRGFTVEVDGDTVSLGLYAFDSLRRPTWRLAVLPLEAAPVTVRPTIFSGGQTLAGAYKAPSGAPAPFAYDDITVFFESACFAAISLNGTLSLERFAFAGGRACRGSEAAPASPRKLLPPERPGDALLTPEQVRQAAARLVWFIDMLPLNDLTAREMFRVARAIDSDFASYQCGPGEASLEREDLDGSKTLTVGDVIWLGFAECRTASAGGIPEYFYDGWVRSTVEYQTAETFGSRLRYYWLNTFSKRDDLWFNGSVQVAGYVDYWWSSYVFQGFVIEGTAFAGPRVSARSGAAHRIGTSTAYELRFDDLDMRLSLDATSRLKVRVKLLDAQRPLLYDWDLNVMQASRQGVVVMELEPGKPDGYQIHLTPTLPNTFEIQYRRGGTVLSTQTGTRTELGDIGRL